MTEIKLERRVKYAGDIHTELLEAGFTPKGAAELLEHCPDADVAPVVHGTWLESISMEPAFGGGFIPRRTYFCSECGLREKMKWPYCHCGAKMDGGMEDV